ncbi:SDR family NAD(P)-dependent oxidoreductase [Polymorphospora rubra]|uniref:2-deoxy-D-gluconate 3-dehydrogenase n=1 Tax=Polymorphospora rubra TaxID=338584 RepID=A0A810N3F1_9ACTN|nr:SDR family oxidoreductase [Polymorphospora rubra]BCJ67992.1 2-deoxy-D-gluconate 3-dehydrogenase [Polymorphospora rubra]
MSGFPDLAGRKAVVTGASRGIGRAIAKALAAAGGTVAVGGRDATALSAVADDIAADGGTAHPYVVDVSDHDSIQRFVAAAVADLGGLDLLVNCAGVLTPGSLLDAGDEPWTLAWQTNVLGTVRMTRAAGAFLTTQGSGRVVNVASNYAFKGVAEHAAYCASKAAVVSFTRSMAVEWAPYGVQVNAIAPGFIATDLNAGIRADPERSARLVKAVPARRFGVVDDVVAAIGPLCDPRSTFLTGTVLTVDGGETAR